MEYMTAVVFSPYYDKIKEAVDDSQTLSKVKGGIIHQAAHASTGSIIGGVIGGPFGAMIGGIAGALIGFVNVSSYATIFTVLNKMAAEERKEVMTKLQDLMTHNIRGTVSKSMTSMKDSVTSYVSEKSQVVTGTVTGSVVSVTDSVISAPGHMASFVYQSTCSATAATTNVVTGMVTQNFMSRYIRKVATTTTKRIIG